MPTATTWESGTSIWLKEIILENFMSYEYARIPLKPRLNLISGPVITCRERKADELLDSMRSGSPGSQPYPPLDLPFHLFFVFSKQPGTF
jgi:hypothetical protein